MLSISAGLTAQPVSHNFLKSDTIADAIAAHLAKCSAVTNTWRCAQIAQRDVPRPYVSLLPATYSGKSRAKSKKKRGKKKAVASTSSDDVPDSAEQPAPARAGLAAVTASGANGFGPSNRDKSSRSQQPSSPPRAQSMPDTRAGRPDQQAELASNNHNAVSHPHPAAAVHSDRHNRTEADSSLDTGHAQHDAAYNDHRQNCPQARRSCLPAASQLSSDPASAVPADTAVEQGTRLYDNAMGPAPRDPQQSKLVHGQSPTTGLHRLQGSQADAAVVQHHQASDVESQLLHIDDIASGHTRSEQADNDTVLEGHHQTQELQYAHTDCRPAHLGLGRGLPSALGHDWQVGTV